MKYTNNKEESKEEARQSHSLLTIARLAAWMKSWVHPLPSLRNKNNDEGEEPARDERGD